MSCISESMQPQEALYRAPDGASLVFHIYNAAASPGSPVFLFLAAMGVEARYYLPLVGCLAATFRAPVALADFRGQGENLRRNGPSEFGYREVLEFDLPAIVARLNRLYPDRPLYVVGHSIGGQFATLLASQHAERIRGLVLLASGTAHYRCWRGIQRWRYYAFIQLIRIVTMILGRYPGSRLGFGGDQPFRFMMDWLAHATTGRYEPIGSEVPYEAGLRSVRLPVLSISVAGDAVAPAEAVDELLRKLAIADIRRISVPGIQRHDTWKRHFSWAREPEEMVSTIRDWIGELRRPQPASKSAAYAEELRASVS
jgi:predicted alpha/beta hydrolase